MLCRNGGSQPVLVSEIDNADNRKWVSESPYAAMYIALGRTIQKPPWKPLTDRCWEFDVEAIEDTGDYVAIFRNLERVSRGEIKFTRLKDFVDIENEVAWVSFSFGGKAYKWKLKVESDWVDVDLFTKIVALTRTSNTAAGRYTYFSTGGQTLVIGFETPAGLEKLKKATGLNIVWLEQLRLDAGAELVKVASFRPLRLRVSAVKTNLLCSESTDQFIDKLSLGGI